MITIKKTLCPDATYTVQYEDATPITSGSIVSGGSALIEVPNCTTPTDADATAFLTATGIVDATISSAINTLVLDLKDKSIWTKMKALYPYVGGTATTHKYNLKNPLDTDGAFRLSFVGGWTHDANGITGNGTNTSANTFLYPNVDFSTVNGSFGLYLRNAQNPTGNTYDMGANSAGFGIALYGTSQLYTMFGTGFNVVSNSNYGGFYAVNRTATNTEGYRNVTKVVDVVGTPTFPTISLCIGSYNVIGSASSSANYGFNFMADTLTGQEIGFLYSAIQRFQTELNR